jgi:fibro-slime domain-containing protein
MSRVPRHPTSAPTRPIALVLALIGVVLGCAGTKPPMLSGAGGGAGGSVISGIGGSVGVAGANPIGTAGRPSLPIPPGCGDGINNQGGTEECDDGNTLAGDGCNGLCHVEANWICPPAGACERAFRCGDGTINPGEVCDDGNTTDGDGCSADCTVQALGYACTPGMKCVSTSVCGNKRVEPGETCDDGNATAGDGCSKSCVLETGYVCPNPGSPCTKVARCGDGVVNVNMGEVCDDGNTAENDGCSGDCKIMGAGCSCIPGMKCSCPEVRCGNGTIEGAEKCDDGNVNNSDGCSSTCQIEMGYACPLRGAPCMPSCGDGMVMPSEQCDPGVMVANMDKACTAQCRWAPGWACSGNPPTECHQTKCGDGKKEGLEACDDGNNRNFDGCSASCQTEPSCQSGMACANKCGDGILLGEQCEDGNNLPGDGCDPTCKPEPGYICTQPPLGNSIQVPITYRDFLAAHPDFEPGASGQNKPTTGLVNANLDAAGKPTYRGPGGGGAGGWITSAATFMDWYRDVANVNHATSATMALYNNGKGAYVNRWGPNGEPWMVPTNQAWCDNTTCGASNCANPPAGQVCAQPCPGWGSNLAACYVKLTPADGTPVFFPVDGDNFTPAGERSVATIPPPYDPSNGYPPELGMPLHNFSFTSEVRSWFPFDASKTYKLDFQGDDDVWVFVNGRLAVDLGGIHTPQAGSVTISSTNNFGMTSGSVYEIAVFQAERQKTSSTYELTLSGFNGALTVCKPNCGDKIVTAPEQCDNGTAANTGGYNKCNADCTLGPFCGDGKQAPEEQCDNGANIDAYGAKSGCAPGCKLPARCGDGLVQTEYAEQCDDGVNDGHYTGCTSTCQRAGYCGDGKVQSPNEQCDDGANDGTYGTCGDPSMPLPNCGAAPHCGDGIVQDQYGEQCEPKSSSDPDCTIACRKPGICGDGVKNGSEECDYGATMNTGAYGGCAAGCVLAPHCGDGIKNGPEECDDGINDNSYGGCSPQCKLAPHCGDGQVTPGYEECDLGASNGPTAACSVVCKFNGK